MKHLVLIACALALSVLPADRVRAQATTVSVTGITADSSGAPVPNMTVTIENEATGQRLTATTDSNGRYQLDNVPAGRYRVFTGSGQAAAAPSREFEVRTGGTNTINLTVSGSTGAPSTDSIVSAQPETLSRRPAQVSADFNTLYGYSMPQSNFMLPNGQVFGTNNLTTLVPGITAGGIGQGAGPAAAGDRPYFNEWRIDGMDNSNKVRPGTPMMYVSNEATRQTALFQNQFEPVFGHSIGGKGDLIAATGTNQFHGQFYDFLQNRNLNAVNQNLANLGIRDNPRYDQNRLGASLGFPLVPSKIFFYGNFEYLPFGFEQPAGGYALAPTAAGFQTLEGTPGISASNLGILQQSVGNLVGPATATTTINGQTVPLGVVNSLTKGWQNSYMSTGAVDFTPWTHDNLHVRFVDNRVLSSNLASPLPTIATGISNYALMASAAETHTFASAATNELRFGYNRWSNFLNTPAGFAGLNGFPAINIGGNADGLFIGPPQDAANAIVNTYHLSDVFGLTWHTHSVKLGFDGLRTIGGQTGFPGFAGTYGYSGLGTFLRDQAPDVVAMRSFGTNRYDGNQYLLSGFLQDSWRVHPNFTLDLGLRYEYDTIPAQLQTQSLNANASVPGGLQFASPHVANHMFAPNVGFAWAPGTTFMARKFVVRSGFGMYYAGLYGSSMFAGAPFGALGAPFAPGITTIQGNLSSTTPGFLANGGIPAPANLGAGNLTPEQSRALTSTFAGKQILPYSMNWNFGVETDLWHSATLDLRYLGTRAVHLPVLQDLNAAAPLAQSLPVFTTQPAQTQLNALPLTLNQLQASQARPLAALGFNGPLYTFAPDGNSWYNGLSITLNQHFAGGVQAIAGYTYSHLYDDSMGNWFDLLSPMRTKASSLYDRRQRLTISGVVDVAPMFKNTFSLVRNVFANVQLSGTYIYQTPQYLPLLSAADTGLIGNGLAGGVLVNPSGNGLFSSSLSPLHNSGGQVVGYLNTNPSASITAGAPGVAGTPLRAAFPLDPTNNFDVALIKGFSYHDRIGFQIRGDAYNLFNHPQFTGGPINSMAYGALWTFPPAFLNPGSAAFDQSQLFMGNNARLLEVGLRVTF